MLVLGPIGNSVVYLQQWSRPLAGVGSAPKRNPNLTQRVRAFGKAGLLEAPGSQNPPTEETRDCE